MCACLLLLCVRTDFCFFDSMLIAIFLSFMLWYKCVYRYILCNFYFHWCKLWYLMISLPEDELIKGWNVLEKKLVLQPLYTVLAVYDLFIWCVCGRSHCSSRSVLVFSTPQCLVADYRYLAEVLVKHVSVNCYLLHRMLSLLLCWIQWCISWIGTDM